jgi:PAS domain S-box-containing protein
MTTKSELITQNEKLLEGIQTRQSKLNDLSSYLSELESQLALIFAASPDIIVFLDESETIVKISDAAFTILGYKRPEMIGKPIWDFITPKDANEARATFSQIKQNKIMYFDGQKSFINQWISKSGNLIKLVWRFSICDDREKHTIGVASDVTQFGSNNFHSFKLLQKAVDSSTDGIAVIDADNNAYVYANKAYEQITGYDIDELIDSKYDMIFSKDTLDSRVFKTLKQCLKKGKNCDVLIECMNKSGEIFYNRMTVSTVVEHGSVVNFIVISRDITDKIGVKYEWSPNAESGFVHLTTPVS